MNPINLSVPEQELPQEPGNLYLLALPGRVLTELTKVAEAQGMTVAAFVAATLDKAIQEHKKRR